MIAPTNPEHVKIIDDLAKKLAEVSIGGVIEYAALSGVAGRDITGRYNYLLQSAREKAEKELGCLFEAVRGVGIKRLAASESPEVGLGILRRIRRGARRGVSRLGRLSTNSLSETENKRVIAYSSMLGAIGMMADGNKARTIAAVVDPAKPVPPTDILEMFRPAK